MACDKAGETKATADCADYADRNRGGKKPAERITASERFVTAMSRVSGKRLTYAQLTGKGTDRIHHPAAGEGQAEPF